MVVYVLSDQCCMLRVGPGLPTKLAGALQRVSYTYGKITRGKVVCSCLAKTPQPRESCHHVDINQIVCWIFDVNWTFHE
jgi:hypothetical protein